MNEALRYRVNSELKNEYNDFIIEKYGNKYSKCGSEIAKLMKFQLTMEGCTKYQDDPDVQAILKKANKNFNSKSKNGKPSDIEREKEIIDERFEQINEKLEILTKKIENKVRRESSKKHGHAEFKKQFKMAFKDYHQVSRRELEQFIMNHADIVDKRSIQSRIQYLESHGVIQTFAPNVYNVSMSNFL